MTARDQIIRVRAARERDRLDLAAGGAILALLAAIGLVILSGDHVGIAVLRFTPDGVASSRSPIQIDFNEAIDPASVDPNFEIAPPVPGKLAVNNTQVTFQPGAPFQPGQTYTVTLHAGVRAVGGRLLVADQHWQVQARAPRVVYQGPVDSHIQNLYLVDPAAPGKPQQITHSERGVLSYDSSPDGSKIVYSELQDPGAAKLSLWDAQTGQSNVLLPCKESECTTPVWQPGGNLIAYEKVDLNLSTGMPPGASRIWLLDLTNGTTRPLFSDSQRIGYMPRWSPDGNKLASYDGNLGGIVIYDFTTKTDQLIVTSQGEVDDFSPDGRWICFPKMVQLSADNYVIHYVLVDLSVTPNVQHDLVPDDDPANDVAVTWLPDSRGVLLARHAPGPGTVGAQIYRVAIDGGAPQPVVLDDSYGDGLMTVSPTGDSFIFQRMARGKTGALPEVWLYHFATHELKQVADNGIWAHWLP